MTQSYNPIRRRVLAGLGALGVVPLSPVALANQQSETGVPLVFECRNNVNSADGLSGLTVAVSGTTTQVQNEGYQYEVVGGLLEDSIKSEDVEILTKDKINVILRYVRVKPAHLEGFAAYEVAVELRGINFSKAGSGQQRDIIVALHFPENQQYHFSRSVFPSSATKPASYVVSTRRQGTVVKPTRTPYNPDLEAAALYEALKRHKIVQIGIYDKNTKSPLLITGGISPDLPGIEKARLQMMEVEKAKLKNRQCTLASGQQGCYLTTATVEAIGLSDDCWELNALRNFRDKSVRHMPGGEDLISQYYNEAPDIIKVVNAREDTRKIWYQFYLFYILPASLCAKLSFAKLTFWIYRRAVKRLLKEAARG